MSTVKKAYGECEHGNVPMLGHSCPQCDAKAAAPKDITELVAQTMFHVWRKRGKGSQAYKKASTVL